MQMTSRGRKLPLPRLLEAAVGGAAAALVFQAMPDIKRYLRMRSM